LVANQVNTKEYIVERRADNSNQFQAIGKVNATQPNGNNQLTYRYDDVNPLTGTSYYRLKIVDNDGKVEYTNTVRISTAGNIQFDVLTYPNPIQNVLNLAISSDKHQATDLLVYDNAGKLVVKRNLDLQIGNNLFLVDEMGKLSTGLYMVKIANKEGTLFTTKVVKK
jgi:fibronectin-binding autotransporter adhesin